MSMTSLWCFLFLILNIFTLFSSVSTADLEQVNVSWVFLFQGVVRKTYQHFFQVNKTDHTFSSLEKCLSPASFWQLNHHCNKIIWDLASY